MRADTDDISHLRHMSVDRTGGKSSFIGGQILRALEDFSDTTIEILRRFAVVLRHSVENTLEIGDVRLPHSSRIIMSDESDE